MDLRSVLNTSDNGERGRPKDPPTPQQQHQSRPAQSPTQYGYRDYGQQPPHLSPGKSIGQDYPRHPPHQQTPTAYPPPGPYQASPAQYPPRASQSLPHHSGPFHDARPPGGMSAPAPALAQSPYRPTPTATNAPGGSTGYPFPSSQVVQEMTSPDQRHHYPPGHYVQQSQSQDVYAQRDGAHSSGSYVQQHQVPQTPPISTTAVSSQQFLHQRSQSAQSTPTPTSAHSQQHFGPPHAHGSPVQTSRPSVEYRQPSQPPTPLGPPQANSVRPAPPPPGSFPHPPSPYQQRLTTMGNGPQPQSPASANATLRRVSGPGHQEPLAADPHQRSKSFQSREPSLSISPRTRVASIASISDRAVASPVDMEKKSLSISHSAVIDSDRAVTPAKRKLDDRNLSPKELEHKETRPPPGEPNGDHADGTQPPSSQSAPRKNRIPRAQSPVWARTVHSLGGKMPNHGNFVLQKRAHSHINGKVDGGSKADRSSRHASPEAARTSTSTASKAAPAVVETGPQDILGPWEASITGVKPIDEISKTVADFVYIHVVNNPDIKEITSRGIEFEIEAKLGTLIDKDTNFRVDRLLDTECVLRDTGRVAFRSSMTEAHHKAFNDFLNQIVIQTDPRAPNGTSRVQVHYKHRREVDRYFELPQDLQNRLPGCVRSRLGSRARNVKARVTYDQKTGQALNKIIKARVADIDIHMPTSPMDCRLSINLEMNWDGPVEELERLGPTQNDKTSDRQKDRLSYTQGHYQIDLTQVTLSTLGPSSTQKMEKEHELEIELASAIVLDQGAKAMGGEANRYQELIEGFLDNVRVLARKGRDFGP
ncbi:mRNA capping enzyme, beta subunit, structural domain protein [Metarhizium album ARSEF 1941]|uniref:mRNA-capping enzyme subunit beta n=1 Tax=Metarhizium album (strain ARSEF 1941) TaxID=1081103 RepID=A0A0B2WR72_METAS|nr:mRNA capping enzyme, beta subunit, structural domain protein [Metarhizium album ARSEF 1941]KHN95475.1 mRNA capping enzyme, beta subunit, structural domain protein [Metarhizium album ARSEF 1941]